MMIENSPRARSVKLRFMEPTGESFARHPTMVPAITTPTSESTAAPTASHAAPPSVNGSMVRPKILRWST